MSLNFRRNEDKRSFQIFIVTGAFWKRKRKRKINRELIDQYALRRGRESGQSAAATAWKVEWIPDPWMSGMTVFGGLLRYVAGRRGF